MRTRKYVIITASVICLAALGTSFMLRSELPDTRQGTVASDSGEISNAGPSEPDKTNYPFFRGQDSHGIAGGSGYPTEWNGSDGKNIGWKIELPKTGQSSPVIWGDKLFITGSADKICEVYCIDKGNGKLLWTGSASGIQGEPEELPQMDNEAGLATSTVAVNEDVVCAIFANGNLVCFDHNGKSLWAKNTGVPSNIYGYSCSLVMFDKTLFVQFDSDKKISLMALDASTGELKWETIRQGRPVWSSPVIAWFEGKPQVVINGNPFVSSYDAATGKELWSVECMSGDVAPSVAVNTAMVYAVTDYVKLAAIKPGAGASIVWEDNTFTPDVSSPVATDKYLFVSTGNGDVACFNAEKGDTLWTHYFADQFYASPVIAGELVYLLDRSGNMHIFKAGPEFKIIAESSLGERADCTPAFSDKKIYIRSKKNNLYCISED